MKKIITILTVLSITSCVSDYDRLKDAQKKYANGVVTPSTGILKQNGYEITVEDTITHQIYGINYFPFSSNKIWTIVNIR